MSDTQAKAARDLLLTEYQAILSTHSVDVVGYPFGSVTPYCLIQSGQPLILISNIAQHTKNILHDERVSLTVVERDADDQQTVGRVTYMGNAKKLSANDSDSIERYYSYFPQSRDYHNTHSFDFYHIELVRARYIGGFGKIYWIEKDELLKPNPFSFTEEKKMIDHMNADHQDAIKHYCTRQGISYADDMMPVMTGIDSEGFHLLIGACIYRFNFDKAAEDAVKVRKILVKMAKR
ncbi:MAG: DUF2470 domain-containing protein [Pseudomonadota bacterium]